MNKEKNFSLKKLLLTILITASCTIFLAFTVTCILCIEMNIDFTASTTLTTNSIENNIKYNSIEETLKMITENDNSNFDNLSEELKNVYGTEYKADDFVLNYVIVDNLNSLLDMFYKIYIYSTIVGIFLGFIIYFTFIEKNKPKEIIYKGIITCGILTFITIIGNVIYQSIINNRIKNYYSLTNNLFESSQSNYLIILISMIIVLTIFLIVNYIYTKTVVNKLNDNLSSFKRNKH